MSLFKNARNIGLLVSASLRRFSTEKKLVDLAINEKNGIATLTLQRPPVNSLNLEFLNEISSALTNVEKSKAKGLILTSGAKSVFSAGLDIMEMYKPDLNRCKQFWTVLQEVWLKLYGSAYPTVAVINGHSPAGGCLLAVSCEYRIMLPNFTIGLNETKLGIVAPSWFVASMLNTISQRQTELALTQGKLFNTDEALKIGLVDEIVPDKDSGIAKAEEFLKSFASVPPMARAYTKQMLRKKSIEDLQNNREADVDVFISFVANEKVQKSLDVYIKSLKQKK